MSRDNGRVVGSTRILNNGSNAARFNIVLLAEGFTDGQQDDFNERCDEFVGVLQGDPWFRGLLPGINVHRVNIESDDAGTDDPESCDGDGTEADTFFDSSFCTGFPVAIRRLMHFDSWLAAEVCDDEVAEWDIAIVVVNSSTLGGAGGGRIAIATVAGDWANTALHELGHSAFGLADEYPYWDNCGEEGHDHPFPGLEPWEANITRAQHGFPPSLAETRSQVKWGHLIDADTPVPTARNPDCGDCPPESNPLDAADEIGLFEGAQYHHCDLFRPAFKCRMRVQARPFCFVCIERAHAVLRPHLPDGPHVVADVDELDFGDLCSGATATLRFRIANLGDVFGEVALESSIGEVTAELQPFGMPPGTLIAEGGLVPGQLARVTVTFGPLDLPSTVPQREIAGDLRVRVDGGTDVVLPLRVTVHRPRAAADISPAELDFGDVAAGLTMYRRLRLRNNSGPCPLALDVYAHELTGPFAFVDTISDELEFQVPGNQTRDVYLKFTAPDEPGAEFTGEFRLVTSDPNAAERVVPLRARAVAPVPVDSVLVIDRSGSMSGETGEEGQHKIDHAIFAVDLYTSLLRGTDGIALVRFNAHSSAGDGDVLVPLAAAGPEPDGAGRQAVRSVLAQGTAGPLHPSGSTSIGAGMLLGSAVLEDGTATRRAIVVLTDGRENEGATIEEAKAEILSQVPAQRLYSVGFGLDQLMASVVAAASETGGSALVTGDVAAAKEFLLQKLFVQILSDEADWSMLEDPIRQLEGGESGFSLVRTAETDLFADFIVTFREGPSFPKYLRTWLKMPSGAVILPDTLEDYPGTRYVVRGSHLCYRVPLPPVPEQPSAHLGPWEVWVANDTRPGEGATLHYSVIGRAFSNLRLGGRLVQRGFAAGAPMEITLSPTLYGVPAAVEEPIRVRVILPDGHTQNMQLHDGAGLYRGTFAETHQVGPYHFDCAAVIRTPSGVPVTRSRYLGGMILPPPKGKGPERARDPRLSELLVQSLLEALRRLRLEPPGRR
ncbi:MAG: VWA domain-containing protein [Planctomycetota bacterium]|nr:MAG: VWA domain-containing protein [Planctomycetota bacterium]